MATQDLFANLLAYKEVGNEGSIPDYSSVFSSDANLGGQFESLLNQSGGWTIAPPVETSNQDYSSVFKDSVAPVLDSSQFSTSGSFNIPETRFEDIAQGRSHPVNLVKATNTTESRPTGTHFRQQQRAAAASRQTPGALTTQQPAPSRLEEQAKAIIKTLDKNLGGWLPGGGVPNPLTRARQSGEQQITNRINLSRQRNARGTIEPGGLASTGAIPNAIAATTAAGVNPIGVALGLPDSIKKLSAHYASNPQEANKYDLPTNLFLRYLSGTGKEGLEISPDQGRAIYETSDIATKRLDNPQFRSDVKEALNNRWPGSGSNIDQGKAPVWISGVSDSPAPGFNTIPQDAGSPGRSALNRSLGSFWASKGPGNSYQVDERYNFMYAPASKDGNEGFQKRMNTLGQFPDLRPDAIGRRIVAHGYGKPFDYSLLVSPNGEVKVR